MKILKGDNENSRGIKVYWENSLVVQWLGLRAISVLRAQVQIKELRSYKPEKKIEGGREEAETVWAAGHQAIQDMLNFRGREERKKGYQ